MPFVHSRAAFEMILVQGPRIALDLAHAQGNPANQVAASNLLEWLGLDAWDIRIEAAVTVLTMATAWLAARRGIRAALAVAELGYALAVSFNPYVFRVCSSRGYCWPQLA